MRGGDLPWGERGGGGDGDHRGLQMLSAPARVVGSSYPLQFSGYLQVYS